jgi:hypothetical protein
MKKMNIFPKNIMVVDAKKTYINNLAAVWR